MAISYSQFKKAAKKEKDRAKRAEKATLDNFRNGGYEDYINAIKQENNRATKQIKSGRAASSYRLNEYQDMINSLNQRTAQSGFDSASLKQLNDISNSYQQNLNTLKQLNTVFAKRDSNQKRIDDINKQLTKNYMFGFESENKKDAELRAKLKKEKTLLKAENEQLNEQIAPFLDRNATKTRLDNEKLFTKARSIAKKDYGLAYKAYHQKQADKYLQNAEIKALAAKVGASSADLDEEQIASGTTNVVQGLLGGNGSYNPSANKAAQSSKDKVYYARQIKQKIKSLGYKGTERDLNDTVNFIVEQAARKENKVRTENMRKELANAAEIHPVLTSAAEAVIGGASKIPGGAYALGKTIEGYISDKPVSMDENSAYFAGSNAYNTITSTVASNIKSKIGKELYLQAMSLADNASRAVLSLGLGGAGEAVGLSIMAMSVMSDTALNLTQQGYDAASAGSLALVAAAAEVVTEKISLDSLQAFKSMSNIASKKILALNIAKQAFVEGSEEVGSDLINNVADLVFEMYSDNSSQKEREIQNKMLEEHITYEEAYKKWHTEHIAEYVKDFAAGAVSGLILGGGATASNYAVNSARQSAKFRAVEDTNAKQTYKQKRQSVKAEINAIQKEYAAKGQPISKTQAKMVFQSRSGNAESGNILYDNLIKSALNHSDTSVQAAANKLQENLNLGKVSYTAAGRLINKMESANTQISAGVATQLLDSAEAPSAVKSAVKNAILGKELTKGEIKQIRGSKSALDIISTLSGERISENSTNEEIEDVARSLYGATFDIDTSTDYGRAYSTAAKLRNEGKIGFNGVKGFTASYNDKLGMSMDDYSNMFAMAYNMAMAKNSSEEIADRMRDNFFGDDEGENIARAHVISVAVANAQNDVAFERAQEAKERANKKAEKQEQSEQTENKEEAEESLAAETQMGLEGENVREHAAALASLSEDEKGEVYQNGGAIVESKKKLDTKQSVIVSAYEHIGKKRGVAYIFVDSINGNKEAKGSHISGLNIIYIRIGDIADMTSAAGHELGHWLKDNYSEEYKKLQEYIKTTLYSKEGYSLEYRIKEIQERYAKEAGQNLSKEEALDEITNNALFGIDMGSAEFEKFIKDNLTIYERILEFFKNLIEDLKDFFSTVTDIREVRELKDDVEFIKSTADIVEGIIGKQSEKIEQAQKENTQEGEVNYSLSDNFDKNYDYSKNISKVANMPVVAKLEGTEFVKGEVDLITQVSNYFDSIGNIVHSKYGDVILDRAGAKSSIGHGIGRNKAIAFKAVPDVIKKGEIVSYSEGYNGGKKDRAVFAAPFSIKNKKYYAAVVVEISKDKNIYYLHEVAITEKENATPFKTGSFPEGSPSGATFSIYSLLNSLQNVKENSVTEQFQLSDSDYMQAIEEGDEQEQERLVEEAAKNWGAYSDEDGKPIMFYHGTKSFGFTEFDLEKMDDKRSIFLTSDEATAQSYSGIGGTRRVVTANYASLSDSEIVEQLNESADPFFEEKYFILNAKEQSEIKKRVDKNIDNLLNFLENHKSLYIDDHISKPMIEKLIEFLQEYNYWQVGSRLQLGNYNMIGRRALRASGIDIDNFNKEIHIICAIYNKGDNLVIRHMDPYMHIKAFTIEEAREYLHSKGGNYAIYAKLDNPLVIDCKGANWNKISVREMDLFAENGKPYRTDYATTREISKSAQIDGYDGVVFKNIRDNGGRGMVEPDVADYITVVFDSSQTKSADPITYDDNGEVIPLSERFGESKDIRYSLSDSDVSKALDKKERRIFYSAINPLTQNDGLRVGENGILIPVDDEQYTYKLIHYSNNGIVSVHDIYKLIGYDYNIHENKPKFAEYLIKIREDGYNEKYTRTVCKNFANMYGTVFQKYSHASGKFVNFARSSNRNGKNNRQEPAGAGIFERDRKPYQITDRTLTPEEEARRRADVAEAENRRLSRDNEKLQQALEYQKKQLRLSKDFRHDSKKTADEAKRLIKKLEVSELTDEQEKAFTEKLEEVYSAIDNAELEGSNNTILGRALEAVKIIKDNIRYTDKHEDIRDRYEAFAEYFKGKTYISEAQAAELRYHFGGVDKANQLVKGLNFVIEHHTSNRTLDNKWGEITELFKEMFEENDLSASDVDEPIILIHAMQNARDIIDGTLYSPFDKEQLSERAENDSYSALVAAEEETENDLAVAIMDSYDDVRWRATFADKKKAQIVALKAKQKQAMSEYRQQVKERTDKKIAELEEKYQRKLDRAERQKAIRDERIEHYKESRKKSIESRKRTELRNKIKKEYLKIAQMAANPTKDKHVPNGLLSVVKDLIYNIQLDDRTNAKALLYFAKIQNEFKALENNPNYNSLIDDYNSALSNYIVRVQSSIGNTDFRDLSAEQLGELYNLVRMIKKCISNGNKMFRFEKQKSVDELRNKVVSELEARQSNKADYFAGSRQFVINDLKPVYFFRHLHSPTMNALYQTLREGQDVWAVDIAEAKEFATKTRDKYHYSDWKLNEKFSFTLESGQEIEMNLLQVMNLRALSRRDNAMNHLLAGGIQLRAGTEETRAFKSRQKAKGKNEKTVYHTSFADIQNIISVLTEDQKRYSDEMQSYLSKEMAQKGNEVSRELYDIDLFRRRKLCSNNQF